MLSFSFVIFLLLGIGTTASFGAESASEAFLGSAWRDPSVSLRSENLKRFGNSGFSNPIEKVQLRLNQNEYIEDRKAILRASPRGWNEYRLMRQLNSQNGRLEDLAYRQGLTKALAARYEALIEYRLSLESRKALAGLLQNSRAVFRMQGASARNSKASAQDLLRAREAVESTQFKLSEADAKLHAISERMKSLDANFKSEAMTFSDWPQPTELRTVLERLEPTKSGLPARNLETQLAREHATRVRDSLEYDVQRETKIIDYFEVSLSEKGQESRYGVEVGINIPGFSGKDFDRQEKARQLVRYEIDARNVEREQELLSGSSRDSLNRFVETYRMISGSTSVHDEGRIKSLAKTADPLLASALERDSLLRELRIAEVTHAAYMAYISSLQASGLLDEKARTNFLSRGLKEIRP